MINIAFWNTYKKSSLTFADALVELILENDIDVIGLCEYNGDISYLVNSSKLEKYGYKSIRHISAPDEMPILYNSEKVNHNTLINETERYSFHEFIAEGMSFALAFLHLPSKVNGNNIVRCQIQTKNLLEDIGAYESFKKHNRIAIIGDFNMDPYESPLLDPSFFHAYPDARDTILPKEIEKEKYYSFYNPSWKMFGDESVPPGTYFYEKESGSPRWHVYDQLLMRYEMFQHYKEHSLRIITATSNHGFLTRNNRPKKILYSDHLPITFTIGG